MVRVGFSMILDLQPDIEVVGQAADGVEAVTVIANTRPDVALLDIRTPRLDGLEVCRRVKQLAAGTEVVIATTFNDPDYVDGALAAGASGFLLKDSGPALLVAAVRAAVSGDALISPEVTVDLLRRSRSARVADSDAAARVAGLTERELDLARLVARGLTNAEVAAALVISLSTVKTHLTNIQQRLGVRNRVEIAATLWSAGVVDPG